MYNTGNTVTSIVVTTVTDDNYSYGDYFIMYANTESL